MQQRRLRLGDILDDYCPRERRITNHAVVAMIEDQVKQTRCTTCDADHEYKAAKVPGLRRKRTDGAADPAEGLLRPRAASGDADTPDQASLGDESSGDGFEAPLPVSVASSATSSATSSAASSATSDAPDAIPADADRDADPDGEPMTAEEDGPVHRRLIRATLPRIEGQGPERKETDFTVRQPGGRGGREFDGNTPGGQRFGQGRRPMRAPGGSSQPPRFGGPRQGPGGPRTGAAPGRPPGNRPGNTGNPGGPGGPRGNRPGQGAGQGAGRGPGRKRGR